MAAGTAVVFRHITVRRFKVNEFQFVNHVLRLDDPEKIERFRQVVSTLPSYHRAQMTEEPELSEEMRPRPMTIRAPVATTSDFDVKPAEGSEHPDKNTQRGAVTSQAGPKKPAH